MGLCDISQGLGSLVSTAASKMKDVQILSERLYMITITLPAIWGFLWIASLVGLIMMSVGVALIIRARKREKK
jgi:uncharacterized integral membrane protein